MSYAGFLFAVLALLATPGPTNTLMALAGAQQGMRRAVRLIPAEMVGYLTTVLPLTVLGPAVFERWPVGTLALKATAAAWVFYLAVRLWRVPARAAAVQHATLRRVYVTTVLNPKAFVLGLVLIPAPQADTFLPRLALFLLVVPLVATIWASGGVVAGDGGSAVRARTIQRAASICLTVLSGMLMATVLRA